jgi:hypothetical protein
MVWDKKVIVYYPSRPKTTDESPAADNIRNIRRKEIQHYINMTNVYKDHYIDHLDRTIGKIKMRASELKMVFNEPHILENISLISKKLRYAGIEFVTKFLFDINEYWSMLASGIDAGRRTELRRNMSRIIGRFRDHGASGISQRNIMLDKDHFTNKIKKYPDIIRYNANIKRT